MKRMRIGVAIEPTHITAIVRSRSEARTVQLDIAADSDLASAARDVLLRLRDEIEAATGAGTAGATVSIALLPPVAETRLLRLPPLRQAEAAAVLRRDGDRHFVMPGPRVVGVRTRRGGSDVPVMAAVAPAALVDALNEAVAAAGWHCGAIVPAHASWLAAARITAGDVVAVHDGVAHIIRIRDGAALTLRRVPAVGAAEVVAAVGVQDGVEPGSAPVVVLAGGAARAPIVSALTAAGRTVAGPDMSAESAAAEHAHAAAPRWLAAAMHTARQSRERRFAVRLAAAAAVLLIAAGALELWGAERELDAVRGRRAAIRAQVQPLVSVRDSVDRLNTRVGALEALDATSPRWTGALFELAMLLPHDAHVTRLHATGDTLVIDAEGARAGTVLQALRTASTLRDARLVGAVDRELDAGSTALERFRIAARLVSAPHGAPPTPGTEAPR